MRLSLTGYLLIAVILLAGGNIFTGYMWATASSRCTASKAVDTGNANEKQAKGERKRDTALDAVATETKADTRKEVAKTQDKTNERAAAIDRVPTSGACRRPDGLPSLDAAVREANAAAGN